MKSVRMQILVFSCLVLFAYLPLYANGASSRIVYWVDEIVTPSIDRNWGEISLLYEDKYHDPQEVDEELSWIEGIAPDIVESEIIGQSIQGRNITCICITNELSSEQKAKALVVAHHHGREQITVELALRFMLHLLNGYGVDENITNFIDTEEIYIIPTLNPDALERVVNLNDNWLRKNLRPFDNDVDGLVDEDPPNDVDEDGRISIFYVWELPNNGDPDFFYFEGIDDDHDGLVNEDEIGLVDLNRNYAKYWGMAPAASHDPTTQTYCGSSPFSEPETIAFRDFAMKHNFAMAYSLHSGINTTYLPSDAYGNFPLPSLYVDILNDYQKILPSSFHWQSRTGLGGIDYPHSFQTGAGGLWKEWMFYERGTTVPVCFEVYHNGTIDSDNAYRLVEENSTHRILEWNWIYEFFDPYEPFIEDLCDELMPAFDYLLRMIPRLDVDVSPGSESINENNEFSVQAAITCLSSRLGSQDAIEVTALNGTIILPLSPVEAQASINHQVTLTWPFALFDKNYTIRFGNNYTGYTRFNVSAQIELLEEFDWYPIVLTIGGVAAAMIVAVLVIYFIRRSS